MVGAWFLSLYTGCMQSLSVMVRSYHGSAPKLPALIVLPGSERSEGWLARCWKLSGGLS